jgi:hypothetical protein
LPACSPNDGSADAGSDASTVALDPSAYLANLTTAQKAELCDWQATRLGGYGTTTSCPGGTGLSVPTSQASCAAGLATSANTCQATVQDEYNCIDSLVQLPCLETYESLPECQLILSCT